MHILLIRPTPAPTALIDELQQEGFSLEVLPDVVNTKALPDVIVVDYDQAFPTYLSHLKQDIRFQALPIMVVIPHDGSLRKSALSGGAVDFLTAPLDSLELLHRIKRLQAANRPGDMEILGHDLKSPLGTILPSLDLIVQTLEEDYPELRELAHDSLQAARRQTMVIDNFLDYWRIRSGTMEFDIQQVDLDEVLETFRYKVLSSLGRRDLNLAYQLPDTLPPVQADSNLLANALVALADNAIKFCARESQITVAVKVVDNAAHIDIADTGRSVMPEYFDRLFEIYDQFEARLAGGRTSIALNLPYARAALRAMGGDVTFSADDNWNYFTAIIPLA